MNREQCRQEQHTKHDAKGNALVCTPSNDKFSYGMVKESSLLTRKSFKHSKYAKPIDYNTAEMDEFNRLITIERELKLCYRREVQEAMHSTMKRRSYQKQLGKSIPVLKRSGYYASGQ